MVFSCWAHLRHTGDDGGSDSCLGGALLPVRFHIGVASCDAMVGNVGTSELFNYTAIGDTVYLARLLEITAQHRQILIHQAIYKIVADKLNVMLLEPVQVKGKSQPVTVYVLKDLK
jgi:class 3 adenylate cyclase